MAQTNRSARAQRNKERIFDAAKALINERGFDNVSIDDITEACGLTKGAFYYHFPSKDALVTFIERAQYLKLAEEMDRIDFPSKIEKLRCFLNRWAELVISDGISFSRQWFRFRAVQSDNARLNYEDGSVQKAEESKMDFDIDAIKEMLDEATDAGELEANTPTEELARTIAFSLYGATFYRNITGREFPLDRWIKDYSEKGIDMLIDPYLAC